MIVRTVKEMLDKDPANPILLLLTAQFKIAEHDRKSGDPLDNDKAKIIVNKLIKGIIRDQKINQTDLTISQKQIDLLKSLY